MRTAVISFTERGIELSRRIKRQMERGEIYETFLYTKCAGFSEKGEDICFVEEPLKEWTGKQFREKDALIFIGACGIAVRSIAPFLQDKLKDIPVLVADEGGNYVIPILSGHYGGGNELAALVAEQIDAVSVITTATDVNGLFAVDVFARKNGFVIGEKRGIARVSAKVLKERYITLLADGEVKGNVPPEVELLTEENIFIEKKIKETMPLQAENLAEIQKTAAETYADVVISVKKDRAALLQLYPKAVILGMGCKKGKTCKEIEVFVLEQLELLHIPIKAVRALATIDRKGEEPGFLEFAEKYGLSFLTYSKEALEAVRGDFSASSFVKNQVGVDNVCERAAVAAAGAEKKPAEKAVKLLLKKTAKDGMTLAVAEEKWSVSFS